MVRSVDEHGNVVDFLAGGAERGVMNGHVQLAGTELMIRIIRPLTSRLSSLSYGSRIHTVPVFAEFFVVVLNDNKYLKGRKTFNYPK